MTNKLYYGDNLQVLRESIADESVDLIYLDPPFNSNASYNVLFRGPKGHESPAQIEAFDDTWHWDLPAESAYDEIMRSGNTDVSEMIRAMRTFLGENDMIAYLVMMAVRLLQLHRVLKPTGSLYLHCDPTASHYLKILLDAVFGKDRYLNEIIWRRTSSHNSKKSLGRIHDIIHVVTKSNDYNFNLVRRPYMKGHVESRYSPDKNGRMRFTSGGNVLSGAGATDGPSCDPWRGFDPASKNRHWAIPTHFEQFMDKKYLEKSPVEKLEALYQAGLVEIKPGNEWPIMVRFLEERDGTTIGDIWAFQPYTQGTVWNTPDGIDEDVKWLGPTDPERLGYPTQKSIGIMERIIAASSNPGDVVLDPFCGCGTTVHAAEKLKRKWIGIDVTHLAIGLIERRLREAFPGIAFETKGVPKDLGGAQALAKADKHEFQQWAISLVPNAQPWKQGKKGADKGIDGVLYVQGPDKKTERAIISVKGGQNIGVAMIRDLKGVLDRENAPMGLFVTLTPPTKPMETEAAASGFWETDWGQVPRVQILTVEQLLLGTGPRIPMSRPDAFRKAAKEDRSSQGDLGL